MLVLDIWLFYDRECGRYLVCSNRGLFMFLIMAIFMNELRARQSIKISKKQNDYS